MPADVRYTSDDRFWSPDSATVMIGLGAIQLLQFIVKLVSRVNAGDGETVKRGHYCNLSDDHCSSISVPPTARHLITSAQPGSATRPAGRSHAQVTPTRSSSGTSPSNSRGGPGRGPRANHRCTRRVHGLLRRAKDLRVELSGRDRLAVIRDGFPIRCGSGHRRIGAGVRLAIGAHATRSSGCDAPRRTPGPRQGGPRNPVKLTRSDI